ncbi:hypothetical protein B296_00032734, partial [Ensete ventricosum]
AKRRRRTTALPCVGSTNGEGHASDAEGPGIAEHGDETTAEVEAHESLEAPHGNAADEESWKPAVPGRGCGSLFVDLLQLDGRWVGAHHRQQPLHDVAHAALPPVEDDRGVLPDQPRDPLLRRLIRPPAARGRLSYRRLTRGKSVAPIADKALVYGRDVTLLARRRSLDGYDLLGRAYDQRRLRSIETIVSSSIVT